MTSYSRAGGRSPIWPMPARPGRLIIGVEASIMDIVTQITQLRDGTNA